MKEPTLEGRLANAITNQEDAIRQLHTCGQITKEERNNLLARTKQKRYYISYSKVNDLLFNKIAGKWQAAPDVYSCIWIELRLNTKYRIIEGIRYVEIPKIMQIISCYQSGKLGGNYIEIYRALNKLKRDINSNRIAV